jgi:hypothetical protein
MPYQADQSTDDIPAGSYYVYLPGDRLFHSIHEGNVVAVRNAQSPGSAIISVPREATIELDVLGVAHLFDSAADSVRALGKDMGTVTIEIEKMVDENQLTFDGLAEEERRISRAARIVYINGTPVPIMRKMLTMLGVKGSSKMVKADCVTALVNYDGPDSAIEEAYSVVTT